MVAIYLSGLFRPLAFCAAFVSAGATFAFAQLTRTPGTTEGPYYIFNSTQRLDTTVLVGADNDLTQVATSTPRASGTHLLLSGQVTNLSGSAVSGATVEIWQTDNNGIYFHSGNSYQLRDVNFQFFGTSVTDAAGNYSFRTVRPGLYTGRIRHIHFKVKLNGTTLLTSQLMFEEDRSQFSRDMVAAELGNSINLVLINPVAGTDASGGSVLIATRQLVVNATGFGTAAAVPVITAQPSAASVSVGDNVSFSVVATSTTALMYQWQKDGTAVAGASSATLTFLNATAANAGTYRVIVTNSSGSTTSSGATLAVMTTTSTLTAALSNLSVRSYLPSSSAVLTAGFVIQSPNGKRILVRAIGPALTEFGVTSALSDPRLEIYNSSNTKIADNDTWDASLSTTFAELGAFALPVGSRDAALTVTLPAGAGSAHVQGTSAGVALVEAYDTASTSASRLVNLSARSTVGAADSTLVAGFSISGTGNKRLLVRAIGPGLADLGVTNTLADPKLEVFNGIGAVIASNDDWLPTLAATFTQAGAFSLVTGSKDAALTVTLPAGASYTVVVSGVNGATGEAIFELYDLQ